MNLTLGKIDTSYLGANYQYRYIIHIHSDKPLSLALIKLWNEALGEHLGWKSIERNRVNPCEVILIVEKSLNFKSSAQERIQRWLQRMTDMAASF